LARAKSLPMVRILPETNRGFGPLDPIIVVVVLHMELISAHQLAMEHNLQTIGVVAHGLNQIYPKTHKSIQSRAERRIHDRF
jgi:hypothetical protein